MGRKPAVRARKAMIRKRAIYCYTSILCALLVRTAFAGISAAQPLPIPLPIAKNTTAWLGIWEVGFALLLIVGLILAIRWLFGRVGLGNTTVVGSKRRNIQIIERKPLGARQSLLLVRCRETEVLIHQSKGRLSTLCVVGSKPSSEEDES